MKYSVLTFLTTMFAMTNPIGNLGIFLGLVAEADDKTIKIISYKTAAYTAIIFVITIWLGPSILHLLDISLPALEAAGGMIIMLIGLSLLHVQQSRMHHAPEDSNDSTDIASIAMVPLAIPLLAGPGTLATIIIFTHHMPSADDHFMLSLVAIGLALLIGLIFSLGHRIRALLSPTGINVLTRLMGLILVAIAWGLLAGGLTGLFPGLKGLG